MVRPNRLFDIALAIVICAVLYAPPSLANPSSACGNGYSIYFANGIYNDQDEAITSMLATENQLDSKLVALQGASQNAPITWDVRFHSSITVGNLYTALQQIATSNQNAAFSALLSNILKNGSLYSRFVIDLTTAALAGGSSQGLGSLYGQFIQPPVALFLAGSAAQATEQALSKIGIPGAAYYDGQVAADSQIYLGDLQSGKNVLVIAHSQGNLYANAAYDNLFANGQHPEFATAFAVASVATPDIRTAPANEMYVTSSNDQVINAVRTSFPNTLVATVIENYALFSDQGCLMQASSAPDCFGHNYLASYLNDGQPTYDAIVTMVTGLFQNLSNTAGCLNLVVAPATSQLTVGGTETLTVSATQGSNPIAAPANLQWNSSNTAAATVTNAVVTGVAAGTATITVTDPVSMAAGTATVTVVSSVMSPPPINYPPGEYLEFQTMYLSTNSNPTLCGVPGIATNNIYIFTLGDDGITWAIAEYSAPDNPVYVGPLPITMPISYSDPSFPLSGSETYSASTGITENLSGVVPALGGAPGSCTATFQITSSLVCSGPDSSHCQPVQRNR